MQTDTVRNDIDGHTIDVSTAIDLNEFYKYIWATWLWRQLSQVAKHPSRPAPYIRKHFKPQIHRDSEFRSVNFDERGIYSFTG